MLAKLSPDNYDLVRSLFAPLGYSLAIDSMLTGLSPGSIYVDELNRPSVALAWTQGRLFFAGETQDEATLLALQRTVYEAFYPDAVIAHARNQGISKIGWHCWESNGASIATALKLGFTLHTSCQVYLAFIDPRQKLEATGYRLTYVSTITGENDV